jgi:hypothetical protein
MRARNRGARYATARRAGCKRLLVAATKGAFEDQLKWKRDRRITFKRAMGEAIYA